MPTASSADISENSSGNTDCCGWNSLDGSFGNLFAAHPPDEGLSAVAADVWAGLLRLKSKMRWKEDYFGDLGWRDVEGN